MYLYCFNPNGFCLQNKDCIIIGTCYSYIENVTLTQMLELHPGKARLIRKPISGIGTALNTEQCRCNSNKMEWNYIGFANVTPGCNRNKMK